MLFRCADATNGEDNGANNADSEPDLHIELFLVWVAVVAVRIDAFCEMV